MITFVQYFLTFYCEFIFGHINVGFVGAENLRSKRTNSDLASIERHTSRRVRLPNQGGPQRKRVQLQRHGKFVEIRLE
jgi:hypothetical protein